MWVQSSLFAADHRSSKTNSRMFKWCTDTTTPVQAHLAPLKLGATLISIRYTNLQLLWTHLCLWKKQLQTLFQLLGLIHSLFVTSLPNGIQLVCQTALVCKFGSPSTKTKQKKNNLLYLLFMRHILVQYKRMYCKLKPKKSKLQVQLQKEINWFRNITRPVSSKDKL